jgi:hypothetical protein
VVAVDKRDAPGSHSPESARVYTLVRLAGAHHEASVQMDQLRSIRHIEVGYMARATMLSRT